MNQNTEEHNPVLLIIIDDVPPSNNEFLGNQKSYRVYNSKKKSWKSLVYNSLPITLPKKPLEKAAVHIHYIFPDRRRRDLDNFSGKFLLDPLVEKGILKDDCYQILADLHLSAEYKPKIKKTIIKVYELERE